MGTRNLVSVWYKGKFVIAQYGQWDGYPQGQGFKILDFLANPSNVEHLILGFPHLYTPSKEEMIAIEEQMRQEESREMEREKQEILGGIYRIPSIGTLPFNRLYPSLSRDTGAKILILVAKLGDPNPSEGPDTAVPTIVPLDSNYQDLSLQSLVLHGKLPVILEPEFALDGFFCEWAYVLDLDRNVLEVYGGYGNLHHGCFDKFFEGDYRNVHLEFTFEALRGMTKSEFESAFCAQNEDEGSMYHEDEGLIPCSD